MRKNVLIAAVLFIALAGISFATGSSETKKETVRLATGGPTGTYYAFGSAAAQILSERTGIGIVVESTGASKANIQLIDAGDVDIALVQNDVMDYAWRGVDLFNGEKINSFASMAGVYAEVCQLVASASSGITSVADLKGKNVSVGDAGSGVEFNSRHIMEAYGLSFDDIVKQNLGVGPSADALRDNKIDAFFFTGGAPTAGIVDLAASKDIVLVEIDDAHAAQLMRAYPFYTQLPIPAATYKGQNTAVKTIAVKATLIVSSKLSENTVYNLTKALFESKAQIEQAHAKGKEISLSYAVEGISVPFHPGAAKYLREVGAIK
jgi:TRAP transporter TAXI family solute receptor